ncbi:phage major capsid protein [Mycobacterium sp. M1]|uniref:Phage major capsid protein n=1 Tax=Mycolicibacter acidiphilus TaxID=2835306 RepID=A0ABS5RKT6_9MYCO|nr:phage major capsid protein [Mycolicibacter acidiphilus]MBS9533539.1 phage major capsid protein [Mycolicibacter acidiphilus]
MAFTHTTETSAAAWRPDLFTYAPETVLPEALIFTATTVAGSIKGDQPAMKVAYAVDADADFVAEGAEIDEAQPDLAEVTVYTAKFAQLLRISREQYAQDGTSGHLALSVQRAMTIKADKALLAQAAPTAGTAPVAGLVNVTGLESQTGVATNLDKLIDLEAAVRANRANPALWVLSPDCWADLRKMKQGTSGAGANVSILGSGTDDAAPRLLSIPVTVNPEVPSKTGLLIDPTAIVSAVSPLEIATSLDRYFSSDSIGVRATMRTGHAVVHPDRIGLFTLT